MGCIGQESLAPLAVPTGLRCPVTALVTTSGPFSTALLWHFQLCVWIMCVVCIWAYHVHVMVEVWGQFCRVEPFLPSHHGFWRLNPGCKAWRLSAFSCWAFSSTMWCIFICLFLKQGLMKLGLAPNSLCSQSWPCTSDPHASSPRWWYHSPTPYLAVIPFL